MLSSMDLNSKYIWAISNANMDVTKNLKLTNVKKYWRYDGQIKKKVNKLYRNQIPAHYLINNFYLLPFLVNKLQKL